MSLPYLILAAFPQALGEGAARTGRWSGLLKQGLGIVMLGVAVYLITTLIPNVTMWPWVLLGSVVLAAGLLGLGADSDGLDGGGDDLERFGASWVLLAGIGMGFRNLLMAQRVVTTTQNVTGTDSSELAVLPNEANGQWIPFNVALDGCGVERWAAGGGGLDGGLVHQLPGLGGVCAVGAVGAGCVSQRPGGSAAGRFEPGQSAGECVQREAGGACDPGAGDFFAGASAGSGGVAGQLHASAW